MSPTAGNDSLPNLLSYPFPGLGGQKLYQQSEGVQGYLLCAQTDAILSEAGDIRAPVLKDLLVTLWARLIQYINQL